MYIALAWLWTSSCIRVEFCHAKYESRYIRLIVPVIITSQSQEFASWWPDPFHSGQRKGAGHETNRITVCSVRCVYLGKTLCYCLAHVLRNPHSKAGLVLKKTCTAQVLLSYAVGILDHRWPTNEPKLYSQCNTFLLLQYIIASAVGSF